MRAALLALPYLLSSLVAASEQSATPSRTPNAATGQQIMQAVQQRQIAFPAVFERQTMIFVDARGHRKSHRLRRFSQVSSDGSGKFLLLVDSPADVAGVALLAKQTADGKMRRQLYLPALGGKIIATSDVQPSAASVEPQSAAHRSPVLGSDFSIEDLSGENPEHYRYERQRDRRIDGSEYFQIAVFNKADDPTTAVAIKRHYVQKNRMVITRSDYFNEFGELRKQLTAHDLQRVTADIWQPNMRFVNNIEASHQTIIKVEQRIFSADYLPANVFSTDWLLANHPPLPLPPANSDAAELKPAQGTAAP